MFSFIIGVLPTALAFILIFGLLVFVHELGHFLMAKRANVKVKEFGFGLPPRLFGIKRGETLYSINWIPLGGFVKMLGQDDFDPDASLESASDPRSFENQKLWTRAVILVAGVVMNFFLAVVLFSIGYSVGMQPLVEGTSSFDKAIEKNGAMVIQVEPGSPAEEGGLQASDLIIGADNQQFLSSEEVREYTQSHQNQSISYQVLRDDTPINIAVINDDPAGIVGMHLQSAINLKTLRYPFYYAPIPAIEDTAVISWLTLKGIGDLVVKLFTSFTLSEDIAGPIGIVQITHNVVQIGIIPVLQFAAILSISLGVLNVMPFPALDGGRLLFLGYELVFRKKPDRRLEGRIHLIGFALLILLIISITYQDLVRIFE